MKKQVIILVYTFLLILVMQNMSAQMVDWNTGLNAIGPNGGFFGTNNAYPLRIYTQNENRMHINHNTAYAINSQPSIARNGHIGIGRSLTPTSIWNNPGPISLLHLNGDEGAMMGTYGYRNWMRNGITMTSNSDMMFMGPRRRGADDITDAVLGWADNASGPNLGPDNMLFVYTTGVGTGNDINGGGADGREIMRLNANGNIGMGPRFSNASQPQSQLHINVEDVLTPWLQFTNQLGTQQTVNDGLRIGANLNAAYIYNQENAPLIFSTNASTVSQLGYERMRLTHIGAAGVPTGGTPGSSRLGISLDPTTPLTEPRSLVHIGENTGLITSGTDGARNWMDVGYLATLDSDNMYVGLKREGSDRQDAVVAWGDNQTDLVNGSGPDNLRFIFANSQFALSPGTAEAKSDNGQEIARFTPACANCPVNTGSLGIGNFSPASANAPGTATYVGATLDVNGDARIRTATQDNTLNQVLVRDPSDLGRIHWRDANTLGNGLGNNCGSAQVPLAVDREVPLGGNDFYFTGQSIPANGNTVNIGIACNGITPAKLNLLQNVGTPVPVSTTGASFRNTDTASNIGLTHIGLSSSSTALQHMSRVNNIAGDFSASGAMVNYAIRARTTTVPGAFNFFNYGGQFQVSGIEGGTNMGVFSSSTNGGDTRGVHGAASSIYASSVQSIGGFFGSVGSARRNFGVYATGNFPDNPGPSSSSFGLYGLALNNISAPPTYPASSAIGVYGHVDPQFPAGVSAFAGYFDGDVFISSTAYGTGYVTVSDAQFKTNVENVRNASEIIAQLQPKTYDFINGDHIGMDFPANHQYGFIAQEVEAVLPELVSSVTKPAMADSSGNIVTPEVKYKGLNYNGFIALLMQDAKDKNERMAEMENQIEQQERINNQLMQKLDELAARIEACCTRPKSLETGDDTDPQQTGAVIQTRLENNEEPTLGQNIPNPFEAATRIPLYLPQNSHKAEIMFYGNDGKILQILPILDRGTVSVDVNSETLASGVYSYTLFVDGKPVDTKRMVKR